MCVGRGPLRSTGGSYDVGMVGGCEAEEMPNNTCISSSAKLISPFKGEK